MQAVVDWVSALDPAWAFLAVLPFAIAIIGVLADRGERRGPRDRERES